MTNETIHPQTHLGYVHLTVADLERSVQFYREALGLQVQRQVDGEATLGAGETDLVRLTEQPGARRANRTTGLYHFAILLPSRRALGRSLRRLAEVDAPVQGFADHLVSEAIYLADPDGNGIELYRDRPRSQWERENGQLKMAVDPLDVDSLLAEAAQDEEPWAGLPPQTVLGHVHLHVANLERAEQFYRELIGFDLMVRYGQAASFLAAGGYHHHLGINTWAGVGAPPPPAGAVGLRYFVICAPEAAALVAVRNRLETAGWPLETREAGLFVRDPSQNGILITADFK